MQLDPDSREFVESFNDHDVRFPVAPSVDRRRWSGSGNDRPRRSRRRPMRAVACGHRVSTDPLRRPRRDAQRRHRRDPRGVPGACPRAPPGSCSLQRPLRWCGLDAGDQRGVSGAQRSGSTSGVRRRSPRFSTTAAWTRSASSADELRAGPHDARVPEPPRPGTDPVEVRAVRCHAGDRRHRRARPVHRSGRAARSRRNHPNRFVCDDRTEQ